MIPHDNFARRRLGRTQELTAKTRGRPGHGVPECTGPGKHGWVVITRSHCIPSVWAMRKLAFFRSTLRARDRDFELLERILALLRVGPVAIAVEAPVNGLGQHVPDFPGNHHLVAVAIMTGNVQLLNGFFAVQP